MPTSVTLSLDEQLLEGLTDPQREAVTHVDGPLLVLAGPGSGKTRVITGRVAYLIRAVGIAPWNVLAITFTNKAAGEMRDRVAAHLTERQARAVTVCTFHALCARILRTFGERLNLPPGYSIYDTADQQRAMKQALADLEVSSTNFPPGRVLGTVSNAKNELQGPDEFAATAHDFYSKNVAKLYRAYQKILTRNHALDFDDLLLKTVELVRHHADVRDQLRQRYQYLMIDEYQDTNHAQFVIANTLASGTTGAAPGSEDASDSGARRNICATGDPDQSIYRWRGADLRNILEFEEHYPDAKVVRLEQNYRSTKRILAVADGLIKHNRRRKHKTLWTENDEGDKVRSVVTADERAEARWLVEEFRRLHEEEKVDWRDMAVFYRINSLSRVIEDALRDAAVPYQIARGTAFYDRKEIKDAIAYLRIIANPDDEVNLLRVINSPARGISDKTVKSLQAHAIAQSASVYQMLGRASEITSLNTRAVNACRQFAGLIQSWRAMVGYDAADTANPKSKTPNPKSDPSFRAFADRILRESGLHEYYANDKGDPDQERLANLGELVSSAQQFEADFTGVATLRFDENGATVDDAAATPQTLAAKLEGYLEQVSLVSDVDVVNSAQGSVTLMTLHAAKGLEYPIVAVVGVEEGLLPHARAQSDDGELEEERRLCFVGITRAERRLILSHARYRTIFGRTEPTIPSRFLDELPVEQVERIDAMDDPLARSDFYDDAFSDAGEFRPGDTVRHAKFGIGTVLTVQGGGHQTRAKVQFNRHGVKNLILEYAGLEKM